MCVLLPIRLYLPLIFLNLVDSEQSVQINNWRIALHDIYENLSFSLINDKTFCKIVGFFFFLKFLF